MPLPPHGHAIRGGLVRPPSIREMEPGYVFAILFYVGRRWEHLDHVRRILQQWPRLHDIRKRIEEGASVEAIGEEIEKSAEEAAESARM